VLVLALPRARNSCIYLPVYGRGKCSRWCSRRVQFRMQELHIYEQQISFVEWEGLKLLIDFLFTVWRTKATNFRKSPSLCVTGILKIQQ